MFGDILYPLNTLRKIDKDTYEFQISKYIYRKTLMERKIPVLNCLWNDVLHCSPIDLRLIYKALIRAGHQKVRNIEFFKIPIELLKNIEFVKYKFERELFDREKKAFNVLTTEDIEPLTIGSYQELNELPNKAIEWYKQCAECSRKPLLFQYIPHIFVKGNIPIKEVEVCDWSN
jgi:hypothetical protein